VALCCLLRAGLGEAWRLLSLPSETSKVCPSQALTRTCCELTSGEAPSGAGFDVSQALSWGCRGGVGGALSGSLGMQHLLPQPGAAQLPPRRGCWSLRLWGWLGLIWGPSELRWLFSCSGYCGRWSVVPALPGPVPSSHLSPGGSL
jgi:hypothetical protein